MNIRITQKIIKDRCGEISYRRGEAYYRAGKVRFDQYNRVGCEATVVSDEEFHVTIGADGHGGFLASCSCPKLASFSRECQHIAAVLLAVQEYERLGVNPVRTKEEEAQQQLSDGLLSLFSKRPARSSGHQRHFETREVLEAEFTCSPVEIGNGRYMVGIEIQVGSVQVLDIRDFLKNVKNGTASTVTLSYVYDPALQCFRKETDAVIHLLIKVVRDEKLYLDALSNARAAEIPHQLLIPPSSFERLLPLLTAAPNVNLAYQGARHEGLQVREGHLGLIFDLSEREGRGYSLTIAGLDSLVVLTDYDLAMAEGKLVLLKRDECQRLLELKKMLKASGTDRLLISEEQLGTFIAQVLPSLKKLGQVRIESSLSERLEKTPLTAKLYLDRIKGRLLAGLEFHYGRLVINPLEDKKPSGALLRDTDKEAEILALMESSQLATTDEGYFLHNEELEYEFLYHVLPKLQKLVQVYATTAVRNRISNKSQPPQIRVRIKKERTNWLEFKFDMDGIPQREISEVLEALEEKRKYYRLKNGSLMSLETREFEAIQRFLHALPVQEVDYEKAFEVPIVKGLHLMDEASGDVLKVEASFREFLEGIRNPDGQAYEVPENLELILRDYQKTGYRWMRTLAAYGFGGILADDMGLGKTLQSIAFLTSMIPEIREKKQPALIVCPSSLTYNWLSEFTKFAPGVEAVVLDGQKAERMLLQKNLSGIDVLITSYPLLRTDILWYAKQNFHTVLFDEAQAFKNPGTQTAKAVKKIQAVHRFALTGTPVENAPEELWSIFHVVFPELFLGLKAFSRLTRKQIARRARPFLMRRIKEDVLEELPRKIESVEASELLPEQKQLYAAYLAKLREDTLKHLDKNTIRKNRIRILAGLTRLRQICCHPELFVDGYHGSSAKYEQLKEILAESKVSGRRVLIFSQFTKMLDIIGRDLAAEGQEFFYLDGQTPSKERVELCSRFNNGERDLFLISLKAGGTGLNLTGADTVILYDLWWNPAVEEQASDRAHRIGQQNQVEVIKLVARGTIEEKMNELQEKKRDLIEEIIDSRDPKTSSLTEEDIREILMI